MADRDKNILAWIYDKLADTFNAVPSGYEKYLQNELTMFILSQPGLALNPDSYDPKHKPQRDEKTARENLADLVDAIPLMVPMYVRTQKTISSMYEQLLAATLPDDKNLPERIEKLKKLNANLYNDDGTPTHQYQRYLDGQKKYNTALVDFRTQLANCKQQDNYPDNWNNGIGITAQKAVDVAENEWISSGKHVIENILADINTLGEDLPHMLWSASDSKFNNSAEIRTTGAPTKYYPSSVIPDDWYALLRQDTADDERWTSIEIVESSERGSLDKTFESTSTSLGGSGSYGLWTIGGGYNDSNKRTTQNTTSESKSIGIKLKCIKVAIQRDWFDASLLGKKFWSISGTAINSWSTGVMEQNNIRNEWTLIPTDFIVARDISITAKFSSEEQALITNATHTGATLSVGWGPFAVSGSYSKDTASAHSEFKKEASGESLTCKSPQIIGWICTLVPASPPLNG